MVPVVRGTVGADPLDPSPVVGYRVELIERGESLTEAFSDEDGDFLLEWNGQLSATTYLLAYTPWGMRVGEHRITPEALDRPVVFAAALPFGERSPMARRKSLVEAEPLVSGRDFEQLYSALGIASQEGHLTGEHGFYGEIAWIYDTVTEIEQLEVLAAAATHGSAVHLDELRMRLRGAPVWPTTRPLPAPSNHPLRDCVVAHVNPFVLTAAAGVLDQYRDRPSQGWGAHAMGYVLARQPSVELAVEAAYAVMDGRITAREFVERLAQCREMLPNVSGHPENHHGDDRTVPAPREAAQHEFRFLPDRWSACVRTWGRCTGRIAGHLDAVLTAADVPVVVGRVEPGAVCLPYSGTLTLLPRVGELFPAAPPVVAPGEGLVLSDGVRTHPLTVVPGSWSPTSITVEFPAGVAASCAVIAWQPPVAAVADRLAAALGTDDCVNLLGPLRPDLGATRFPERRLASLGVGGPPTVVWFTAAGQRGPVHTAESCTDVWLSWNIVGGGCGQRGAIGVGKGGLPLWGGGQTRVRLLVDGVILLAEAPPFGSVRVRERATRTYVVEAESVAGSMSCGSTSATLTVRREGRISLSAPERIFYPDRPVPIRVAINCAAPEWGQLISLSSSEPKTMPGGSVLIPAGQTEAVAHLNPTGAQLTPVDITATAADHQSASIRVYVNTRSCIPAPFIPEPERWGGSWTVAADLSPFGVVGIHMAVLHTGKVLLWGYDEGNPNDLDPFNDIAFTIAHAGLARCATWDPRTNVITPVTLNRNLFCSGHAFLGDGRLLVAGGQFPAPGIPHGDGAHRDVNLFDPVTETWSRLSTDLAVGRWYPTCVTLSDGRVLVVSGTNKAFSLPGGIQDSLEILSPSGTPVVFETLGFNVFHLYPFAHVLPARRLFMHWKRRDGVYNYTTTPGTWALHLYGPLFSGGTPLGTNWPVSRTGPGPGTSVLLPQHPGPSGYPPGRVMIVGGGGAEGDSDPAVPGEDQTGLTFTTPATNTVEIMDFGRPNTFEWANPEWQVATPMANPRVMPDSVLLPDGRVLVVNGSSRGRSGGFMAHFGHPIGADMPVNEAEMYDPQENTWERLCPATLPRLYHATAALLPDGRVVVAGHDGFLNRAPMNNSEYRLEVFSPPYLFRGPRPTIRVAPSTATYGQAFMIGVNDAEDIASVALIRQSSVTHQTNTDQRYVGLRIGSRLTREIGVAMPPDGGVAPPGWYMLFVVNRRGVPSVAHWMRVIL